MKPVNGVVAYIDGANLYKGIDSLGWRLDYARFRVWLSDKYGVSVAYIFIGLTPKNKDLYTYLQRVGFILVFKEVIFDDNGKAKGNCDADLVIKAMRDSYEREMSKAVLVTSDGDYAPLVKFWLERSQLSVILSPASEKKCSVLLKHTNANITYINDQRGLLERKNEKAPGRDEPSKGLFHGNM